MAGVIITKDSALNDSLYGKTQYPVKRHIEERAEAWELSQNVKNIFYMDTSKNFAEQYTSETSGGDFKPVGENGSYELNSFQEGYSSVVEFVTWKDAFAISAEMIEDVKMGKIKRAATAFTGRYYRTREKFGAYLLSSGISTTMTFGGKVFSITSGDGLALFHQTHTSKTSNASFTNDSNLYNAAFTYDNLSRLETVMQNYQDDDGNLLAIQPDTIIIPNNANLKQAVFEALNADGNPNTADRAGNFHLGRWNVIINPYLTTPTGATSAGWWMLMDSNYNKEYAGLPFVDRLPLTIKSYIDNDTDANIWGGRARFSAKPNDWRCIAAAIPGLGDTLT